MKKEFKEFINKIDMYKFSMSMIIINWLIALIKYISDPKYNIEMAFIGMFGCIVIIKLMETFNKWVDRL